MNILMVVCAWVCAIVGAGALLAGAAWLYWFVFDRFLKAFDLNKAFHAFIFQEFKNNRHKYRWWMGKPKD